MFLAGYNNVEVAEFLLENGADVNVQDKGGLIPLHNASSYGVSLLVKSQTLLFVLLHPQLMKMGQRYTLVIRRSVKFVVGLLVKVVSQTPSIVFKSYKLFLFFMVCLISLTYQRGSVLITIIDSSTVTYN